jgi:cytoskeletal protein RodZ
MNRGNLRSPAFWLLLVSLLVLVAVSTIILIKNVLSEDKTEVLTTVKAEEASESASIEQPSPATPASTPPTPTPTAEKPAASPAPTAAPAPTASPAPQEVSKPYTGEPKFEGISYREHRVSGRVLGLDPAEYAVVLFIKVGGNYYIKPSWAGAMTYPDDDGAFAMRAYTDDENKWNDMTATAYSVFCVPMDFDPWDMSNFSDVKSVREASVLAAEDLPTGN